MRGMWLFFYNKKKVMQQYAFSEANRSLVAFSSLFTEYLE